MVCASWFDFHKEMIEHQMGINMIRWRRIRKHMMMWIAFLAISLASCKQPLYITENDQDEMLRLSNNPLLETDPGIGTNVPYYDGPSQVRTVLNPDAPPKYLSMAEAFSIALEKGNEGISTLTGQSNPLLGNSSGGAFGGDDPIRAFAVDPAVLGSNIERALSKFDAQFLSTMQWQKADNAVLNALTNFQNGDFASLSSGVYKPLPTGGLAGITLSTNYTKLSAVPTGFQVVNPAYQPALTFQFEQPLLKSFGVGINQLLPQHPGSIQIANLGPSGGTTVDGIMVTRVRFDQGRYEFQRHVNNMIFNVEAAYWNLYAAYWNLYAAEQGLMQARTTYDLYTVLVASGKNTEYELAQVRGQFYDFRNSRLIALQNVLTAEKELRSLLGLPGQDGTRIVPADAPTLSPFMPNFSQAVNDMRMYRPELNEARQEMKVRQMDLMLQKNGMRPDLRFYSSYNVNGIGNSLDGSPDSNALNSFVHDHFNSWTMGFRLNVPLGTRDAHAATRNSRLNLARAYTVLQNTQRKAEIDVLISLQQLVSYYEQIKLLREKRKSYAQQLEGLIVRVRLGKDSLLNLLTAQQNFAASLGQEHQAIANYNIFLARFQYSKGTILDYNNITIGEGQLPTNALKKATDHFRERTSGIILRERPGAPKNDGPVALPNLLENAPKVETELPMPPDSQSKLNLYNPFGDFIKSMPNAQAQKAPTISPFQPESNYPIVTNNRIPLDQLKANDDVNTPLPNSGSSSAPGASNNAPGIPGSSIGNPLQNSNIPSAPEKMPNGPANGPTIGSPFQPATGNPQQQQRTNNSNTSGSNTNSLPPNLSGISSLLDDK